MADIIEIEALDGSIVEFPAGTDDATIESVMAGMVETSAPADPVDPRAVAFSEESGIPIASQNTGGHAGEAFAEGVTFNLADEIAGLGAAAAALFTDDDADDEFDRAFKESEARRAAFSERNPIASTALEVGGALTSGIAAGGPLLKGAKAGLGALGVGGRTAGIAAIPVAAGVEGAIAGAGAADPGERLMGAAVGGGVGAVAGPALNLAANVAKPVVRGITTRLGNRERASLNRVVRALQADGLTPEQAGARVREMGPAAALADTGPNAQALLEIAAFRPGPGLNTVRDWARERGGLQFERVMTGLRGVVRPASKEVLDAAETSPRFTAALETPVPLTNQLKRVLNRKSLRDAYADAIDLASEKDVILPALDDVLNGAPDGKRYAEVDTTVLHWLKKTLDDIIEPKRGPSGAFEQKFGKNKLESLKKTRHEFRSLVEKLNPAYKAALEETGHGLRQDSAFDIGKKFLRTESANDIRRVVSSFKDPSQVRAYERGVVQSISDRMTKLGEVGRDVAGPIRQQGAKLRAAFGKERGDRIIKMLDDEMTLRMTENNAIGGSRTAFRQQGFEDFDSAIPDIMAGGTGITPAGLARIARSALNAVDTPRRLGGDIAEIMTGRDPGVLARQAIESALQKDLIDAASVGVAGAAGGRAAGVEE